MDQFPLIWTVVKENVEPVLAVIAIVFAIVQFLDSRRQLRNLRDQGQALVDVTALQSEQYRKIMDVSALESKQNEQIVTMAAVQSQQSEKIVGMADSISKQSEQIVSMAGSMSTRYVGPFPKNMSEIIDVAKRADRTLWIATDFADYGSYSTPSLYRSLSSIIVEKGLAQQISVKILHYAEQLSRQTAMDQISSDKFYGKDGCAAERESEIYKKFCSKKNGLRPTSTYEEFITALINYQEVETTFFKDRGVEIRTTHQPLPVFLWIEDEEDCIFAFKYRNGPKRGYSFRTRDGYLLADYSGLFQHLWDSNQPVTNLISAHAASS